MPYSRFLKHDAAKIRAGKISLLCDADYGRRMLRDLVKRLAAQQRTHFWKVERRYDEYRSRIPLGSSTNTSWAAPARFTVLNGQVQFAEYQLAVAAICASCATSWALRWRWARGGTGLRGRPQPVLFAGRGQESTGRI